MRHNQTMTQHNAGRRKSRRPNPVTESVTAAKAELDLVDPSNLTEALPHLRAAHEMVTRAIDEAMAAVVVGDEGNLRTAGALAGLSENAVGPRLARTSLLAAYGSPAGRVTAAGIERARYDLEQGRHRPADDQSEAQPMRFKARRPT